MVGQVANRRRVTLAAVGNSRPTYAELAFRLAFRGATLRQSGRPSGFRSLLFATTGGSTASRHVGRTNALPRPVVCHG